MESSEKAQRDKTEDRAPEDVGESAAAPGTAPSEPPAPASTEPPARTSYAVVFVLMLASIVSSFSASALNVSIPAIGAEFLVSVASLGQFIVSFTICSVALTLPLGRFGDLSSRRTLLMCGLMLFSASAAITAFVPSMSLMLVMRVISGIGGACIFATTQAIMADAFPPQVRGRMLGLSTSAVYIGQAAGPILGGFITQHLGWRMVFIFMAALGLTAFFVALGRLPKNSSRVESSALIHNLDIFGMILYMSGIAMLAWGLNNLTGNIVADILAVVGLVILAGFIWWENRASSPLLDLRLFKNGLSFGLSNLSALMNYGSTFAVSYLMSIYLQQIKGFGADISGLVLITAPVVQATVTILAGRLSDRYSPFKLASMGSACCAAALISFIFVGPDSSMVHIFANLILVGTGFGLFASPNTNAVMSLVPRGDLGIAASFLGTMRNLGQVSGMAVITIVMTFFLGSQPITQVAPTDLAHVIRVCFTIFSCICLLGVFTSLQRNRHVKTDGS
ncbi:MAG: MFS transporter [Coriobacteriia bacterium]|nr:MFS transporter [Coriobacteriia bacterium]